MSRIMRRRPPGASGGGERGAGAVDLVMVSAFLLIPTAMLLLSLPLMVEYRSLADAAAREAVRACAAAPNPVSGQARADKIAKRILGDRGLSPVKPIICRGDWRPGRVVSVTVCVRVPAISVVGFGNIGSVNIERTYRERIESTRSLPQEPASSSPTPDCERIESTRSLPT